MAAAETITVLFTGLVGSTEAAERTGHQAYERFHQQQFAAKREAITGRHGTEVKTAGTALMAVFMGTGDTMTCGVPMQREQPRLHRRCISTRLRIGAEASQVTKDGGEYFGTPIVRASCHCAAGHQVLVADAIRGRERSRQHDSRPASALEQESSARRSRPVRSWTKRRTTK